MRFLGRARVREPEAAVILPHFRLQEAMDVRKRKRLRKSETVRV